jgi:dipeptidase E
MKLYLSSYRIGRRGADLAGLLEGHKRVAVIRNALDFSTDAERLRAGREREIASLTDLGITAEELDLRKYFGTPHELRRTLHDFAGVWVVGGNTFLLRRAMALSGLDAMLRERAEDREFVYAGYSAGACVLAPSLRGIHLADEPTRVASGYPEAVPWDGLGLIPFAIVPHYRSDHPESPLMEAVVSYFVEHGVPFITLRDGDVYIGKTGQEPAPIPARDGAE